MGAADSKLTFRKGVFRLFEDKVKNQKITAKLIYNFLIYYIYT